MGVYILQYVKYIYSKTNIKKPIAIKTSVLRVTIDMRYNILLVKTLSENSLNL